ncbi:MAG: heterodisulfide reductase-related iron-sulfur binding cluster, partial [Planctomycetota bacterium]|nr:heterodisulfide reductase-related iron-sulfur binding cluster [Planctomycetota bacterium]
IVYAQKVSIGVEIVPLCSGCNTTLLEAVHILSRDDDLLNMVNKRLEKENLRYEGEVTVRHFVKYLDSLTEERLRSCVRNRLDGLNVACFYGCHLLKPSDVMKPDSVRFPQFMERLVSIVGATPVEYGLSSACCGKGSLDDTVSFDITKTIVERIVSSGSVDAIVCACPFCFSAFESYLAQAKVALPVLFLSQLFALAYGASAETMGKGFHRVKIDGILDRYSGARREALKVQG